MLNLKKKITLIEFTVFFPHQNENSCQGTTIYSLSSQKVVNIREVDNVIYVEICKITYFNFIFQNVQMRRGQSTMSG